MKLYIVATPIGNLKDVTLRALEILREVDFILAEDTRVTKKLLERYKIEKPLISYHHHSKLNKLKKILDILREGKNLALVSDAGTPGISDPGNKLIADILDSNLADKVEIVPIPGPSAIITLASVAGIFMDRFQFLGFPPHKKGRNKYFRKILDSDIPIIFFESPHRIVKTLEQLKELVDSYPLLSPAKRGGRGNLPPTAYRLVMGRELTKQFETIYRGTVIDVLTQLKKDVIKGEFTIILYKTK